MRPALLAAFAAAAALAQPPVPAGLDAYRMWDRWPEQRIGVRAYMRSTYDRAGGNERADASHFLYQLGDDRNVTLDVEGAGILYFARYNHWHGSPWHYEVDGRDHVVRETSTADPLHPAPDSVFLPQSAFPNPLTWTWSATRGADLMWVPVAFEKRFRMMYERTFYGTGYYIYHQFVPGTKLTQPIRAWDASQAPAADVLALVSRAGSDLAPAGLQEASGHMAKAGAVWEGRGPAMIRALDLTVPRAQALAFSRARLRITWDGRAAPSIDAPVGLFFAAGILYNRDNREYLVKSFPMVVRYEGERVHLACYLPMPFFRKARIELTGGAVQDVEWRVRWAPYREPPNQTAYLHATYRDHATPVTGQDMVLLDTRETEGGGAWSGSFIGTSFIFSHDAALNTLEGDPRFFFDDSRTPQAYGTGTEEWGGGGDYWGGLNMTLPFAGHPAGAKSAKDAVSAEDRVESAYRFLLADLMPFGRNAVIRLEHGGTNESTEHYETVTYWYGLPAASLVQTDEMRVGDAASERAHRYASPDASAPYEITSRYEWGPDTIQGKEIYPAETDRGRHTRTWSEFTLKIDPKNMGVMLRRKLDYSFPNQRAEVSVDGHPAGVWYLAGSNTCVFSAPRGELGATQHVVQTSNRRFRDDEFLLPRALTAGRRAIRVRVQFTPVETPLFPGQPVAGLAWSEIRYTAYSFVLPRFH
ncbi:MAG: DUF2961 domain-containing protein [Acidobacteriota bacterium]|nr:DUF2961 domain-containing protein [Acidobacteriota bacterium]